MADDVSRLRAALADRYTLERELGRGGMATVWLAQDLKHDRPVALKVLRPELAAALGPERFLREIHLTARLTHPHILPLHDSGVADGFLFYVMPYVEGESLRDRLDREKQLPLDDALQIAREVADALSYAHSHDVVHRDIKPENILLEAGHAVVADFGIARAITAAGGEKLTATGIAVGTPAYMSPEQGAGSRELDGRSDLYSLGCVLYEMLAGRPPFVGPTVESVVHQHIAAEPPPITSIRPAVPAAVVAALSRALAKTPADRFRTAGDLSSTLAQGVGAAGEGPRPARQRRHRLVGLVAGSAVVIGAAAVVWPRFSGHRGSEADGLLERSWVLLADFDGPADDPALATAVRELVGAEFDDSRRFVTVPPDQLREARQAALLPDTARLTEEVARHLAYRSSVRIVVAGRVNRAGPEQYALVLRAVAVDDGAALAAASGAAGTDDIVAQVLRLSRQLRESLGERGAGSASSSAGIDAITPSLEALRKLSAARERSGAGDWIGAVRLAREAVRIDPAFAAAWSLLAVMYTNLGFADSARAADDQVGRHSERLTRRGRLLYEASLLARGESDDAEFRAWEDLRREFPNNDGVLNTFGILLLQRGQYEEALQTFRDAVAASPLVPSAQIVGNYAGALAAVGRTDEAVDLYERIGAPLGQRLNLMVALGEWTGVESVAVAVRDQAGQAATRRLRGIYALAAAQAARGQLGLADRTLDEAGRFATGQGLATGHDPSCARLLLRLVSGRRPESEDGRSPGDTAVPAIVVHGAWAAFAGDSVLARRHLVVMRARKWDVGGPRWRTGTLLEAAVLAAQDDWQGVVQVLGEAALQGGGLGDRIDFYGELGLRRWLVAEGYERLGRLDSAAAYLEMLVTPTRMAWWDGLTKGIAFSFAEFRLGRLYEKLGDVERAKRHYGIFLDTFTSPDPAYAWMADDARRALAEAERGGG